ncbi:MAG: hypothetical protein L3J66_05665 [Bacteroidales bacterium]|nr:hypothetical protein [Bacteroidales bacterium]
MKKLLVILFVLFFSGTGSIVIAQQNCQVLIPAIVGNYFGKCKKGLAHGKGKAIGIDTYEGVFRRGLPNGNGTYTWANGDEYQGKWVDGQMSGEGVLTIKTDKGDSLIAGIWKENEYLGPLPARPEVIGTEYVEKYRFRRTGDGSKILIDILINGTDNTNIENFSIIGTSGGEIRLGRSFGYDNVSFPFYCKISYITWNKLHTSKHRARFEFKITEPGEWQVYVYN